MESSELTNLVQQYKTLKTHRERALFEQRIWVRFYASKPQSSDEKRRLRRDILAELLDVPLSAVDIRSQILHCDIPVGNLLWDLLDNKSMPLHTTIKLLRTAMERSRNNSEPLLQSLSSLIADMNPEGNNHGHAVHLSTGRVFFRKNRSSLKPRDPVSKNPPSTSSEVTDEQGVWMGIRKLLTQELERRMAGLDKTVTDALWHEIDIELKVCVDSIQNKIFRIKKREVSGRGVTMDALPRTKVLYACRTLHMDPPEKHGKPIDMKFAQRMKRKLAMLYHPDNHGGSDAERPRYEAVMQAYDILEQYMSALNERAN